MKKSEMCPKDADTTVNKIKELLEDIRPYLNMDGGDISFVKYENEYEIGWVGR